MCVCVCVCVCECVRAHLSVVSVLLVTVLAYCNAMFWFVQLSTVQLNVISMCSGSPICTPSCLSGVAPILVCNYCVTISVEYIVEWLATITYTFRVFLEG